MSEGKKTATEQDCNVIFEVDNSSASKSYAALILHLKNYYSSGWVLLNIEHPSKFIKLVTMRGNCQKLCKAKVLWE
ncbi:MAG: hypothetical protein ABF719_10725 [Acetobacter sp.]